MDVKDLEYIAPWDWPEDSDKLLSQVLRDRSAPVSDRVLASELIGDSGLIDTRLAEDLLTIVLENDETEELRSAAAIGLGPVLEEMSDEMAAPSGNEPIAFQLFRRIQESLRKLYLDAGQPKLLRRRTLEASVRAAEDWNRAAAASAFASGDEEWRLTAVFCMGYLPGFDDEIVEALESENPETHYQAVWAAGEREVQAAWSHVTELVTAEDIDKDLLLVAIAAVASINPEEAPMVLCDLMDSDDEDVEEAVMDALTMAEKPWDHEDLDDEDLDDEDL